MRTVEEIRDKLKGMEEEARASLQIFSQGLESDPAYHLQWSTRLFVAAATLGTCSTLLGQLTGYEASQMAPDRLHQALQSHCIKELCILANAALTEPASPTLGLYQRARTYVYGQLVEYFGK